MSDWPAQLAHYLRQGACVQITVGPIKGSAPREPGCRMWVTETQTHGTIGGGRLEFTAISKARELLNAGDTHDQLVVRYGLGPAMNQCCGGAVSLLYERFQSAVPEWLDSLIQHPQQQTILIRRVGSQGHQNWIYPLDEEQLPVEISSNVRQFADSTKQSANLINIKSTDGEYWIERIHRQATPIYLFGAGHVGKALIHVLSTLPFDITWLDSRDNQFPETQYPNVQKVATNQLSDKVQHAPADTLFLVMTHSHELDEDLCHQILKRQDFRWLGLIGSVTKRRRFVHRLKQRGISEEQLERLTCPIGETKQWGKQPAIIAVAVAAQLLAMTQARSDQ